VSKPHSFLDRIYSKVITFTKSSLVAQASAPAPHVNSSVTFLDIAQYILGYEKETTLCFPAKGLLMMSVL
jgi:hypothetical protein